jgi:hypothetical protein
MELTFPNMTKTLEEKAQAVELSYSKETLHQVVTQIEARYWLIGEYPDGQAINELYELNFTVLKEMLPAVNAALTKRELPSWDPWNKTLARDELDPAFVIAVNKLVDVSDKRSRTVKLKEVGLTTTKFNILLKSRQNKAYYEARAEEAFGNVAPVAKTSLGKLVESGDLQAIKYYHEFTGIHDPNKELNNNLNKLISLFFEVLVAHVDPKIVDTIAKEFDVKMIELR